MTNYKTTIFILFIIFYLLSGTIRTQTLDTCNLVWTPPVQLSNDTMSVGWPQILRNGNDVFVLWQRGDYKGYGVDYTISSNAGLTWAQPQVLVSPTINDNTGLVRCNASGNWIYVIWHGCEPCWPDPNTINDIRLLRSSDFGKTWFPLQKIPNVFFYNTTALLNNYFININDSLYNSRILYSPNNGESFTKLPIIPTRWQGDYFKAFEATLSGLLAFTDRPLQVGGTNEVEYFRSTDFGLTWDTPKLLSTIDNFNVNVWDMAAWGDKIYAIWNDGKFGGIFSGTIIQRKSNDGGKNFGQEQILSTKIVARYNVSVKHNLIGITFDTGDNMNYEFGHIYYTLSTNHGDNYCLPKRVENSYFLSGHPDIAVDDDIYIAGSFFESISSNRKIFFTRSSKITNVSGKQNDNIDEFYLGEPYPNPFNNSVILEYYLPKQTKVIVDIYNLIGQSVRRLKNTELSAGLHRIEWDGKDGNSNILPSGIYFIKLNTTYKTFIKKVVYLK